MADPVRQFSRPSHPRLVRALSVLVGCGLGLVLALLSLVAYIFYCRLTHTELDGRLRRVPWLRRNLIDREYRQLLESLAIHDAGWFRATWDLDKSVPLSRALFRPTTMYGESKFRFKPNQNVLDFTVWSGMDWRSFLTKPKRLVVAALHRCVVLRVVSFETDERGCKRSLREEPGWPAVLFVGDSFTEGLHVAPEDTFVSRYGEAARAAGLDINVVNGGVNGYSALEEAWTVEHLAPLVRPRLVIVNLFPNDVERDYLGVIAHGAPEASYARMFANLERIEKLCATSGIRLAVAAIPPMEQIRFRLSDRFWQRRVAAWCRQRKVAYVDTLPRLRDVGVPRAYLEWDGHFSGEGHLRYAQELFAQTEGMLRAAVLDR